MARGLGMCLFIVILSLPSTPLPAPHGSAFAQGAEMDAKGEAEAKEALRLYKQGLYDDAAKIFAKLSVDYPDMLIFERNLGACFYYLRKPEPALSNLRHYLSQKQDIQPDDKQVVERWIGEMEKLREQSAAAPQTQPLPSTPLLTAPGDAPLSGSTAASPTPAMLQPGYPPPPAQTAPPPAPLLQAPAVASNTSTQSPAMDVTSRPPSNDVADQGSPFYAKWWFWGTAGVVVVGAVTAYIFATHGGTQNACSGGSLPCDAIK